MDVLGKPPRPRKEPGRCPKVHRQVNWGKCSQPRCPGSPRARLPGLGWNTLGRNARSPRGTFYAGAGDAPRPPQRPSLPFRTWFGQYRGRRRPCRGSCPCRGPVVLIRHLRSSYRGPRLAQQRLVAPLPQVAPAPPAKALASSSRGLRIVESSPLLRGTFSRLARCRLPTTLRLSLLCSLLLVVE